MADTTSGDAVQEKPAKVTKAASSAKSQSSANQNMRATSSAVEWRQILVDVLAEGKKYGVNAGIANYQNDAALVRLPGMRACSGSGSGKHLVFLEDMLPEGDICVHCSKGK